MLSAKDFASNKFYWGIVSILSVEVEDKSVNGHKWRVVRAVVKRKDGKMFETSRSEAVWGYKQIVPKE